MSDFIVESDEDEEEKDARLALKRWLGKCKAIIVLDLNQERDTPEEQEVILGRKKTPEEAIWLTPKFEGMFNFADLRYLTYTACSI